MENLFQPSVVNAEVSKMNKRGDKGRDGKVLETLKFGLHDGRIR